MHDASVAQQHFVAEDERCWAEIRGDVRLRGIAFELPPRLNFACLPTPIVPLERTTARWGGPRIWIKRDDETGSVVTGNKIRKLQYVVHEALTMGADTLVTCGGAQSNHCRTTAAVARRVGMDVVLCLRGPAPEREEGNYFLDRVFGAQIRWITADEYTRNEEVMAAVTDELRTAGRRPFVIAEGASMATGVWGYIEACMEIAAAQRRLGVKFDAIVHAVGSGGTSAGIELGARMWDLEARICGVNVCDDEAHFRSVIHRIATQAIDRFALPVSLAAGEVGLIDGYVGRGYALSRPEELELLVDFARAEGVVLDPVYSGKALFALREEIRADRMKDVENVLFIHTGGVFGLFPKAGELPLSNG